ncbi:MAG: hypothetical protein GY937_16095 [bacterium]|nr:hypothetical protein [bacterium]
MNIGVLDVLLFDLHRALPLVGRDMLNADFRFVGHPDDYGMQFEKPPFEAEGFLVRPLRRELKRNRFWQHFLGSSRSGQWRSHIPFELIDQQKLEVQLDGRTLSALQPTILLWPWGWSSQLRFTLEPQTRIDDVRTQLERLGDRTQRPFVAPEGGGLSMGDLFAQLSKRLKQAIYVNSGTAPGSVIFHRRRVLSIYASNKGPAPYKKHSWRPERPLADADRAGLQSLLLGREVKLDEAVERENERAFLLTFLSGTDFAMTDFKRGSLLYLVDTGGGGGKSRSSLRCLTANVATCALVSEALAGLAGANPPQGVAIQDELLGSAESMLTELDLRYNNPFCRGLFRSHTKLQPFRGIPYS